MRYLTEQVKVGIGKNRHNPAARTWIGWILSCILGTDGSSGTFVKLLRHFNEGIDEY